MRMAARIMVAELRAIDTLRTAANIGLAKFHAVEHLASTKLSSINFHSTSGGAN
jgi:hypothetical protein